MEIFNLKEEFLNSDLKYVLNKNKLSHLCVNTDEDLKEENNILNFSVSYFNHHLTENEYINENFVCYSDLYTNQNLMDDINEVFNRFISLYKEIFNLNNGFVYADTGTIIYKSNEWDTFLRWIIDGLKESKLCTLVFPKLNLVISFGYDFTHHFFLINSDKNFIKKIENLAKEFYLNIIRKDELQQT